MQRRHFVALIGGAAVAWPLTARAQQAANLRRIGLLAAGSAAAQGPWVAALLQRLRELGWSEGNNAAFELFYAEGHLDHLAKTAADYVRQNVDLIVAVGTPAALTAKQATSAIPIVFTGVTDPIGAGLIAGLARPGGNVTGLTTQSGETTGKRLELLRELVPNLRRLAIVTNPNNEANRLETSGTQKAAPALGLVVEIVDVRGNQDIIPAFARLNERADAVYVSGDQVLFNNRVGIAILAASQRLPTVGNQHEYAEAGGLVAYGPDFVELFRHTAEVADKILRGAKPADLPVEQPTKFDLAVNLTTAKAIGLVVPQTILVVADRVVE